MNCIVDGCTAKIEKEGFKLCYPHWKAEKAGKIRQCTACQRWFEMTASLCGDCAADAAEETSSGVGGMLSSTRLGEKINLPTRRANLLLAELGWIEKNIKGWRVTDQGKKVGGVQKEARQTGIPYAVWPAAVLQNKVLVSAVREANGEAESSQPCLYNSDDDRRDYYSRIKSRGIPGAIPGYAPHHRWAHGPLSR